jgi:hypothetical protein
MLKKLSDKTKLRRLRSVNEFLVGVLTNIVIATLKDEVINRITEYEEEGLTKDILNEIFEDVKFHMNFYYKDQLRSCMVKASPFLKGINKKARELVIEQLEETFVTIMDEHITECKKSMLRNKKIFKQAKNG